MERSFNELDELPLSTVYSRRRKEEVNIIDKGVRINREIRAREVRVIDPEGKQLGILPLVEALRTAANSNWTW